ncbi:MAG TPA: 2-oxoglutarate and iron-dependent oxygenase domain-containing protein, partial [Holophagaceae bacterium]|nr:2-oxoglutarate and iron-dependent oxygenase domain-containing protein [Holophagaceae bacterium]
MATSTFRVETVHLAQFTEGSPKERAEFVRVLGESLTHTGFVKVAGHRVTKADVDAAYRDIQAFFALPEAVKLQYLVPGGGGARGYTPFGQEHAKD